MHKSAGLASGVTLDASFSAIFFKAAAKAYTQSYAEAPNWFNVSAPNLATYLSMKVLAAPLVALELKCDKYETSWGIVLISNPSIYVSIPSRPSQPKYTASFATLPTACFIKIDAGV